MQSPLTIVARRDLDQRLYEAAARAGVAGGADVIGWDDSDDIVAKATAAGIPTADLRHVDWSRIAARVATRRVGPVMTE